MRNMSNTELEKLTSGVHFLDTAHHDTRDVDPFVLRSLLKFGTKKSYKKRLVGGYYSKCEISVPGPPYAFTAGMLPLGEFFHC